MKTLLFCVLFAFASVAACAQGRRIEIVCEVTATDIKYGAVAGFLPDSLKGQLVRIGNVRREDVDVVNLLCLRGWTLVSVAQVKDNSNFFTVPTYYLKRELFVSEEEYRAIIERTQKLLKQ